MQCERCRSYAINPGQNGRGDDDLHLCDVCYWRARAEAKEELDEPLAAACREWLKGCTCAPADAPQRCAECTNAFLESLVRRAQQLGLPVGENAINGTPR